MAVDDKNMNIIEFWKSFTLMDAVMRVGEFWAAVMCSCINRA
jgi:hypothetical protein